MELSKLFDVIFMALCGISHLLHKEKMTIHRIEKLNLNTSTWAQSLWWFFDMLAEHSWQLPAFQVKQHGDATN